jgi:hypothetical protein
MKNIPDRTSEFKADSLSLMGAFALGTGAMIGAGFFELTGQMGCRLFSRTLEKQEKALNMLPQCASYLRNQSTYETTNYSRIPTSCGIRLCSIWACFRGPPPFQPRP